MLVTPIARCSFALTRIQTSPGAVHGTKCQEAAVTGVGGIFLCEEHARQMRAEITETIGGQ